MRVSNPMGLRQHVRFLQREFLQASRSKRLSLRNAFNCSPRLRWSRECNRSIVAFKPTKAAINHQEVGCIVRKGF